MAETNRIAVVQPVVAPAGPTPPPKSIDEQNKETGGEKGKKAPALGTDQRPVVLPQVVQPKDQKNTTLDNTEKGKLGDGGPSADAKGINQGNLREEEEQPPQQNATAGGPDAGKTPANAPGLSHP